MPQRHLRRLECQSAMYFNALLSNAEKEAVWLWRYRRSSPVRRFIGCVGKLTLTEFCKKKTWIIIITKLSTRKMYIVQREPYPLHAETQLLKYQLINREKNSHCAPHYLYNNLKEFWLGPNGQFRIEKRYLFEQKHDLWVLGYYYSADCLRKFSMRANSSI